MAVEYQQGWCGYNDVVAISFFFSYRVAEQIQVAQVLESAEDSESTLQVCNFVPIKAKLLKEFEVDKGASF